MEKNQPKQTVLIGFGSPSWKGTEAVHSARTAIADEGGTFQKVGPVTSTAVKAADLTGGHNSLSSGTDSNLPKVAGKYRGVGVGLQVLTLMPCRLS